MYKILLFFVGCLTLLNSCDLFRPVERPSKHDVLLFGSFIKEVDNSYHLFSRAQENCNNGVSYAENAPYIDTLTVEGKLYRHVFFVQVIPAKLDKNYKNLENLVPCVLRDIYVDGDTLRKEITGFGTRKFLVAENVVGLQ